MTIFAPIQPSILAASPFDTPQDDDELSAVNFFSGFGDWTTPGNHALGAAAWSRANTRVGLSQATGPAGGSFPVTLIPTDGQFYGYTESSAGEVSYSLQSPTLDASLGEHTLNLLLHMRFGVAGVENDGTLQVFGWNGSAWSQIGPSIIGSQQAEQIDPYLPSSNFGIYTSTGFTNPDFHWGILFTPGASANTFNYDCALDNIVATGPVGGLVDDPAPPPPGNEVNGIFAELSGADGVNAYSSLGWNLNFPNPEQSHNRFNLTSNPAPFAGSRSLGHELRASDPPSFVDRGRAANKRRLEISGRNNVGQFAENQEGWFGFAVYLPSTPMANIRGLTFMQLHAFTEEMQMSCFGGNLNIKSDGPGNNSTHASLNLQTFKGGLLDRWIRIRGNFFPSTGNNGFLRVWIDDDPENNPTVNYSGRTFPQAPYFKAFLYWWGTNTTPPDNTTTFARAFTDNIRLGNQNSDFDSVDPFNFVRND